MKKHLKLKRLLLTFLNNYLIKSQSYSCFTKFKGGKVVTSSSLGMKMGCLV